MAHRGCVLLFACLFALVPTGCGSSKEGQVSGKVVLGDQVLKSDKEITWEVLFVTADGAQHANPVGLDGKFTVQKVPAGETKVAVIGRPRVPVGFSSGKAPPLGEANETLLKQVARYKNPEKSGLKYTVVGGTQTHDLVLAP